MQKILVVEDEVELLELYSMILGNEYIVFTTDSGREAIEIFDRERPEVIIVDIKLPDISGVEVTKHAKTINPNVSIIGISAYRERFKEILEAGAVTVLQKPFLVKDIRKVIQDLT